MSSREVLGALDAAHRAQDELLLALVDAAAGDLDVLRPDRALHLVDRQAVGGEPVGVEHDVDGALEPADERHRADAALRLDVLLDLPAWRSR